MTKTLTLWDSIDDPSEHKGLVFTWGGYVENESLYSLLRYVETHGERLRKKYLEFIHELGEMRIQGKRLIDHLDVGNGLSLWWMSLLAEKSIWKSPNIDTVIRLFALEEIILQHEPDKIILASSNQSLHQVLSSFCNDLGLVYEWEQLPSLSSRKLNLKHIYQALPHPAQALVFLTRHIWCRWPFRQAEKSAWFNGSKSIFFCSYFVQVVPRLAGEGQFYSRFWGDLSGLMRRLGLFGNWLQHFYPHDAVPSSQVALDWVQGFNQQRQEQGFHTFLDAYLSWSIVLRVFRCWLKLMRTSWELSEIKHVFRPSGSKLSLWPLMREDWRASVHGSVAINNLLWVELFDRALRDLPHQNKGFYLCENIAWERALIHAWRKQGHGQLIAVVHGAVRFWDMRYFNDPRTVESSEPHPMPQADLTALNGKAAVEAYISADYPKEAIVESESLRSNYLHEFRVARSPRKVNGGGIKVLILGDFSPSGTTKMMKMLEEAALHASNLATYTIKPHPYYKVASSDYPSLNLKVVMNPLEEILGDFDIAYSTNLTSAAVDAYIAGLQVVVMFNNAEMNFSPLRGMVGVCFVNTAEEMAKAMQMVEEKGVNTPDANDFFFLDPELPRWRKLLSTVSTPYKAKM
jgi:surface carbohydrate biosynthesis protein (TIGR04326 family)